MCCRDKSAEDGSTAAFRLSATCFATRVAQCERLLKETRPERALRWLPTHSRSQRPGCSSPTRLVSQRSSAPGPLRTAADKHALISLSSAAQLTALHTKPRRRSSTRSRRWAAIERGEGRDIRPAAAVDSQEHPSVQAFPPSTASLWRWRSKRPAVVLNLHLTLRCGCSRSRLGGRPSPNAAWRLLPPYSSC